MGNNGEPKISNACGEAGIKVITSAAAGVVAVLTIYKTEVMFNVYITAHRPVCTS